MSIEIAMVILCGCTTSLPRFPRWLKGSKEERSHASQGYRGKGYGWGSRSKLKADGMGTLESGASGMASEVIIEMQEWRMLR